MTSNMTDLRAMPLQALETLHMGTLTRDELETLSRHAWGMDFEIQCDDFAATKGLMPIARRWSSLHYAAKAELETRYEMET